MTMRDIKLKRLQANTEIQKIDDSLSSVVEVYFKRETVLQLLDASEAKDADDDALKSLSEISADKTFSFRLAQDNTHRLMKQVRNYQRINAIFFSQRKDLTHYTFDTRKLRIERFNVTEKANRTRIIHLYECEDHERFDELVALVSALK